MSDNELARVKRIGKPTPKSNIDQVLAWRTQNLELRAQNAELLAALRDMVGSHGLVQRVICVAGESDPVDAMRNAKALLSRIAKVTP